MRERLLHWLWGWVLLRQLRIRWGWLLRRLRIRQGWLGRRLRIGWRRWLRRRGWLRMRHRQGGWGRDLILAFPRRMRMSIFGGWVRYRCRVCGRARYYILQSGCVASTTISDYPFRLYSKVISIARWHPTYKLRTYWPGRIAAQAPKAVCSHRFSVKESACNFSSGKLETSI